MSTYSLNPAPLTKKDWYDFNTKKLEELSPSFLLEAVAFLTKHIADSTKEIIRKTYEEEEDGNWLSAHHFGWGMSIRNALRTEGLRDDMLPDRNWDDYYGAIVEIVCGIRPMPGGYNNEIKSE